MKVFDGITTLDSSESSFLLWHLFLHSVLLIGHEKNLRLSNSGFNGSPKYVRVQPCCLIGGSLTIGIAFALAAGSLGVFNWSYALSLVIGAIIGMNPYVHLLDKKE